MDLAGAAAGTGAAAAAEKLATSGAENGRSWELDASSRLYEVCYVPDLSGDFQSEISFPLDGDIAEVSWETKVGHPQYRIAVWN